MRAPRLLYVDQHRGAAAGKTTLTQALRGEEIKYYKTQYVNYLDTVIDTPGEYTERRETSGALALYAYEADVVGLVLSANEPYSIFSPCLTSMVNRETIGIITGIDKPDANVERVRRWLQLAGCKKVFAVSSITGEGVQELLAYLREDMPQRRKKTADASVERTNVAVNKTLDTWLL